jgi:excisionase family DNA binding protein
MRLRESCGVSDKDIHRLGLTLRGACRQYGLSNRAIKSAIQSGQLRASRIGRRRLLILRADFEEWVRTHRVSQTNSES